MSDLKVGFIGLGTMGFPMASNLLAKGVPLLVNDIACSRTEALTAKFGNASNASYSDIALSCKIVFLILPSGKIVKDVLFSDGGLLGYGPEKDMIVVDMSSVAPHESIEIASRLRDAGIEFLDAPVSGGEEKAIDGTLSFMVGGKGDVYNKIEPYFELMGTSSVLIGETGSGSMTKLVNQVIVNNTIAAISEGFTLASKAGIPLDKVFSAIRGGLAGSRVLETKVPKMLSRDFSPGGSLSINMKDIGNVIDTARFLNCPVPYSSMLFEIMKTLKNRDLLKEDHSALIKYFEEIAENKVILEK